MKNLWLYLRQHVEFCVIIIAAVVTRCYKIATQPLGMHIDEIGMAYDAWSLANYGVDRWLQSWPVYLTNYGTGQSALYAYLCVPLIKLFGMNVTTVRIPAILFSVLTLIFGIKIVNILGKGKRTAIIFALLYLVSPYFLMAARFGLDCNLMLGMSTVFLYFYIKMVQMQRYRDMIVAGIFCGAILYTYVLSYLIVPAFLILSLIYMVALRKLNLKQIVVFGIPVFLLAFPLMLVQYVNITGADAIHIGIFTITKLDSYRGGELFFPRWYDFARTLKSIFIDDGLEYNTLPQYGTMYWVSIPFCVLGVAGTVYQVVRSALKREWNAEIFFLIWCGLELLLGAMLLGSGPNANKLNGIFIALLYFTAVGINMIVHRGGGIWKRASCVVLACVYMMCSVKFYYYYFVTQPSEEATNYLFYPLITEAVEYIEEDEELSQRTVYVVNGMYTYVNYLLSSRTSPYEYGTSDSGKSEYGNYVFDAVPGVEQDACYIFVKPSTAGDGQTLEELLRENGFQTVEFAGYYLMY